MSDHAWIGKSIREAIAAARANELRVRIKDLESKREIARNEKGKGGITAWASNGVIVKVRDE